jgi:uncharacterized delta-60 repeat protein
MRKRITNALLNLALLVSAITSLNVCSQPAGILDPSFNGTGYIGALPISASELTESGERLLLQPDGKILAAGQCDATLNNPVACLARLNANGSLDTSFDGPDANGTGTGDGHGKFLLRIGVPGTTNFHPKIALQADGKIVVAATCIVASQRKFCVARLHPDGRFDASFGGLDAEGPGYVILPNFVDATASTLTAIALQLDGRIVLAGECQLATEGRLAFCLARIDALGRVDETFDGPDATQDGLGQGNGQFVLPSLWSNSGASGNETPTALAVQGDGTILVAGSCDSLTRKIACVAKLTYDGRFEPGFFDSNNAIRGRSLFGGGGNTPVFARVNTMALQPDGKIVVAGVCRDVSNVGNFVMCLARLRRNGEIDRLPSGASDPTGMLVLPTIVPDESSRIDTVLLQSNGQIVVVGACRGAGGGALQRLCVARTVADDTRMDTTFGEGRNSPPDKTHFSIVNAFFFPGDALLQPDGKIVVIGRCDPTVAGTKAKFCLARIQGGVTTNRECSLDIDGDGRVSALTDGLINARIALGLTGDAVISGVRFGAGAQRADWVSIRSFLVTQCEMSLP